MTDPHDYDPRDADVGIFPDEECPAVEPPSEDEMDRAWAEEVEMLRNGLLNG